MEKDSFENQLRNKVLLAELSINQNSNKEGVWNAIQKKRKPQRKLYYSAAAIAIMFFSFALYFNQKQEIITIKKEFTAQNPASVSSLEENVNEIKTAILPTRKGLNPITKTQLKMDTNVAVTPEKIVVMPEQEVAMATKNTTIVPVEQNQAIINNQAIEQSFTVQFKRGTFIAQNNNESLIIATLKKFKLKRDTTYFANAEEKQPTKIKLSFKKEN